MAAATIFESMSALADQTRCRSLLLLEKEELSVSELCTVLQMPQSTVSRHLRILGDEGWVTSRAVQTSRRYRASPALLEPSARALWSVVREQVAATPAARHDAVRLREILALRPNRTQEFFSSAAGQWDRIRAELFGRRADLLACLALLDPRWTVGDLGCGTGQLAASLAPFVQRVIAVDDSPEMLDAARARLSLLDNVEVRGGRLEALPVATGELDAAVLSLALGYIDEPGDALHDCARVLSSGGRVVIADIMPHDRDDVRLELGQERAGIAEDSVLQWLEDAGFRHATCRPLPPDPEARGPLLFLASGVRG